MLSPWTGGKKKEGRVDTSDKSLFLRPEDYDAMGEEEKKERSEAIKMRMKEMQMKGMGSK